MNFIADLLLWAARPARSGRHHPVLRTVASQPCRCVGARSFVTDAWPALSAKRLTIDELPVN
jgi:hypothetical protein